MKFCSLSSKGPQTQKESNDKIKVCISIVILNHLMVNMGKFDLIVWMYAFNGQCHCPERKYYQSSLLHCSECGGHQEAQVQGLVYRLNITGLYWGPP